MPRHAIYAFPPLSASSWANSRLATLLANPLAIGARMVALLAVRAAAKALRDKNMVEVVVLSQLRSGELWSDMRFTVGFGILLQVAWNGSRDVSLTPARWGEEAVEHAEYHSLLQMVVFPG